MATETEIGAALCAIDAGRTLTFFDTHNLCVDAALIKVFSCN